MLGESARRSASLGTGWSVLDGAGKKFTDGTLCSEKTLLPTLGSGADNDSRRRSFPHI